MLPFLLAAALTFTPEHAHLAYTTAEGLVTQFTPRDAGTSRGKCAANYILDQASMTGADVRRDSWMAKTPKGNRNFTNLTASFQSSAEGEWVVIVSHFDTKPGVACPGANDGASTSGLLVALAEALGEWSTPRGNVLLVWTDGEECMEAYRDDDGLWGSRRAVERLKEKDMKIRAVICLDMLGDRNLDISIPKNGSPALAKIAQHAAKKAGIEDKVKVTDEIVRDDHVPFMNAGFKAIDLIDFRYGSAPGQNDYWHTSKDTMDKISEKSLEESGRLVVEMLKVLLI